ncbi:putative peptidase [Pirellulimonas nuda]|uniref:Putative peptidase n=1 Tax=Pirellulimonas nuda TaxID=2528009 RepID=A0A518D7Q2_9BACT|nr:Xaa-Pro peptidase family protein [Pirellulimonas nuda]QDU87507.1 putative peptidase [Pirellulimonas nuda]
MRPLPISSTELQARIARAQRLMRDYNLDALLLPAGTSLRYFTGVRWSLSERLLAAVLPAEGPPRFVAPAFEEPKVRQLVSIGDEVRVWQEDESPFEVVAGLLSDLNAKRVGLEETTPYAFVRGLAAAAPSIEWADAVPVVSGCRMHKSAAEIEIIRYAMNLTLDVHRQTHQSLRPGVRTTDIAGEIDRLHRAAGADDGSTFCIVAFGPSTAFPHGPDGVQSLAEGDTVLVDTGCTVHGYHADMTRTYVFGDPSARQREVWNIEREAQQAAFAVIQPGVPCSAVDDAARAVLTRHGLGPDYRTPGLPHRTGHGLGMDIHERPYMVRGNNLPLAPGMVGSIEPMICVYGELGVRLEDHFYVTDSGAVWFTQPSPAIDSPFGA